MAPQARGENGKAFEVSEEKIRQTVVRFLKKNHPWRDGDVRIRDVRVPGSVVLPSRSYELSIRISPNTRYLGRTPLQLVFDLGRAGKKRIWASAYVEVMRPVVIARYPMDVDLYQSQKALDNGKLGLNEGGILILVSKCRTGVGGKTFFELLAGSKDPKEALKRIDRGYVLGYHKAAKMAEIALWAEIWAVTDLPDADIESVFMRPFSDIQQALDRALEVKGREAKILFLMDGSLTVPMIR